MAPWMRGAAGRWPTAYAMEAFASTHEVCPAAVVAVREEAAPAGPTCDEFEHGDLEAHEMDANTADYSIHMFIEPDEARDPMSSDDIDQDAAHNAMRSRILSAESCASEDTTSPENL